MTTDEMADDLANQMVPYADISFEDLAKILHTRLSYHALTSPLPTGVSLTQLASIRLIVSKQRKALSQYELPPFGYEALLDSLETLLEHIEAVHEIMRRCDGPEQEAYLVGYDRGHSSGEEGGRLAERQLVISQAIALFQPTYDSERMLVGEVVSKLQTLRTTE